MTDFFHSFKTKSDIRNSLLTIYGFTALFYWFVYSCSIEYNKFGYILLHNKGHISKITDQGAINTIIFSKYLVSLCLILSTYYTISAILSLKKRTMYVPGTDKEFINCPACNSSLIIKGSAKIVCSNCRAKADDFILEHIIKLSSSKKVDDLKISSLISLTVALKVSLIFMLFIS